MIAAAGILGGLVLEKGSIKDVAQFTAALIVVGGTLGAMLVNTPFDTFKKAFGSLRGVFFEQTHKRAALIDEIIVYAAKARKNGILSLEAEALAIRNPFLRKAVNLAVDGTDLEDLKAIMELEIYASEHESESIAKVFDCGGGFAPTIGIIGAVLGLIQVMKNLANIEAVGHGIAVAFVATVYGVALANLFMLPAAGKIRARAAEDAQLKELALNGVIGIVEGSNPKLIRSKLSAYLHDAKEETVSRPASVAARAAA